MYDSFIVLYLELIIRTYYLKLFLCYKEDKGT